MKVAKLVLMIALAVSMAGCVNISGVKETDADGKTTSRESYSFGTVPPAGVGVGVGIGIVPRNQYGHGPHVGPYEYRPYGSARPIPRSGGALMCWDSQGNRIRCFPPRNYRY